MLKRCLKIALKAVFYWFGYKISQTDKNSIRIVAKKTEAQMRKETQDRLTRIEGFYRQERLSEMYSTRKRT